MNNLNLDNATLIATSLRGFSTVIVTPLQYETIWEIAEYGDCGTIIVSYLKK